MKGGIFGWDLPPGVTESMLPGNRPQDIAWDNAIERVLDEHPDLDYDKDREEVESQALIITELLESQREAAEEDAAEQRREEE